MILCRVCKLPIKKWYDKSMEPKPANICEGCRITEHEQKEKDNLTLKLTKKLHEMIIKYEPKLCWKCSTPLIPGNNYFGYSDDPMTPYNPDPTESCDKCPLWEPWGKDSSDSEN